MKKPEDILKKKKKKKVIFKIYITSFFGGGIRWDEVPRHRCSSLICWFVSFLTEACLFSGVARTMQKNDRSGDDNQRESVSEDQLFVFLSAFILHPFLHPFFVIFHL